MGEESPGTGPRSDSKSSFSERPDIAERVLRYFRENPTVMDSVEGVARFWVHEDRSVVERSLVELHARGLLAKRLIAGTGFYFLPRGSLNPALPEPPTTQDVKEPDRVQARAVGRILVVDHDPSVRERLVDALTAAGHGVAAAEDGGGALEMVRAERFDLVVADVAMPRSSGIEVLKAVKHESPGTEVILISDHPGSEVALQSLRHGAYDLIPKPILDLEGLYRVVGRALEKGRLVADSHMLVENLQARNRELTDTVARLDAVNEVATAMAGLLELEEIYSSLVRLVAHHLKARRVSVLIEEPETEAMTLVASVGITEEEAVNRRMRVGEGIAGRVAITQAPLLVKDIERTDLKNLRTGGRYATSSFMITPLSLAYPIRYKRKSVGVISVADKLSGEEFNAQDLQFLSTLASQMAVAIENAQLVKEMEGGYHRVLAGLIEARESTHKETQGHSRRVTELATAVGRALHLAEVRVGLLAQAGMLHEIGRLSTKPAKGADSDAGWTPADALAAERVLASIASLKAVREIILCSANPVESAQIPDLAEQVGVPIESSILAACEEFARLTHGGTDDPERVRKALQILQQGAGDRYEPQVVAALAEIAQGEGRG